LIKTRTGCGATTSDSYTISVLEASGNINDTNNIILSGQYDNNSMVWLNDSEILITHKGHLEFYTKRANVKGFNIRYDTVPPTPFDSTKRPDFTITDIQQIELPRGEWRWDDRIWDFQSDKKLIIRNQDSLNYIGKIIKSSHIIDGVAGMHKSWLSIDLILNTGKEEIILIKNASNDGYFMYKNDWYEGNKLAEIMNHFLQDNMN
jgi:hypothetical protein